MVQALDIEGLHAVIENTNQSSQHLKAAQLNSQPVILDAVTVKSSNSKRKSHNGQQIIEQLASSHDRNLVDDLQDIQAAASKGASNIQSVPYTS